MSELQEFLEFTKNQRVTFSRNIAPNFANRFTVDERVQIENLIIAYDQLVQRLENQLKEQLEAVGV